MKAFYGTPLPDDERFAFLDRALDLGCTHWDSAALYGDSEELLGKWFQRTGKRSEVCQDPPGSPKPCLPPAPLAASYSS